MGRSLPVILDTSVLTAALRSRRGTTFVLLQAVRRGRLTPLATPSLFLEYEEVMKRPEQRELSNLSLADVDWVLKRPGGHGASAVAPATA
jgi:predicted nucleic acid-binding protein